ncbi:U2 small nuclear ribonucleoprotein auxiliary factor 35 kDa subunit-related protein 2-like [Littorina saxatilis]|uniref:C3H1-type domain-containing protein n=1 Tax=Littorina saxatilis TaxID=31220 RepID=A0AAN9G0T8_9CAEN
MASDVAGGDQQPSKLSHKQWKRLKRKQKRKAQAQQQKEKTPSSEGTDAEEEERRRKEIEEENERQNAEWERRDRLAHQRWLQKKEQEEREKRKREEQERKIREEWQERERKEREDAEKREKAQSERQQKQDSLLKRATENEHKDWHNPLAPTKPSSSAITASNGEIVRDVNRCPFFTKTGTCRFGDRCSRVHVRPESGTTILIPGMFQSFELKKSSTDDYDTDMNLEYEDGDLYRSFRDFYLDVVPEFKSVGKLVNFKVCCNHEPHLRGNVYVQYKRESDAYDAFVKFNARWYAGRQLSCELVDIAKWKSAICGLFFSKRCPKGAACNFLHVFKNPGNEFWEADRDFENSSRRDNRDREGTPRWHPQSDRRSQHRRRSRSRSRSRESSRSQSIRHTHRSTKDRSRSPVTRSRRSAERETSVSRRKRGRSPSPTHQDRSHSRSIQPSPYRSHSRSIQPSPYRNLDRSAKRRHRSRSLSPRDGDSVSRNKHSRSRSRSRSAESNRGSSGEKKKHKKSKHKKSKKSSKKKKGEKSAVSGKVSLEHLKDSDNDEAVMSKNNMEDCAKNITVVQAKANDNDDTVMSTNNMEDCARNKIVGKRSNDKNGDETVMSKNSMEDCARNEIVEKRYNDKNGDETVMSKNKMEDCARKDSVGQKYPENNDRSSDEDPEKIADTDIIHKQSESSEDGAGVNDFDTKSDCVMNGDCKS